VKSELSEEEKYRVAIQVDYFIEVMEKRSGMTFSEMLSLVQWTRDHKSSVDRLGTGTAWALLAMVISALGYAVVEGLKRIFSGQQPPPI
jgi:hypothetical protein